VIPTSLKVSVERKLWLPDRTTEPSFSWMAYQVTSTCWPLLLRSNVSCVVDVRRPRTSFCAMSVAVPSSEL
jgi:hypothetical protein